MPLGPMPPGGDDNAIQYNEEGVLAGDPNLTWDTDTQILTNTSLTIDGTNGIIVASGGITIGDETGNTTIGSPNTNGQAVFLLAGDTSVEVANSGDSINLTFGTGGAFELLFSDSGIVPSDDNVQNLGASGFAFAEGWFGTKAEFGGGGHINADQTGEIFVATVGNDVDLTLQAGDDVILNPTGDLVINASIGFTGTITAAELTTKDVTVTKGIVTNFAASGNLASGVYAPGSFTTPTGSFLIMANHLILTTTQQAVLAGTAQLRMI